MTDLSQFFDFSKIHGKKGKPAAPPAPAPSTPPVDPPVQAPAPTPAPAEPVPTEVQGQIDSMRLQLAVYNNAEALHPGGPDFRSEEQKQFEEQQFTPVYEISKSEPVSHVTHTEQPYDPEDFHELFSEALATPTPAPLPPPSAPKPMGRPPNIAKKEMHARRRAVLEEWKDKVDFAELQRRTRYAELMAQVVQQLETYDTNLSMLRREFARLKMIPADDWDGQYKPR